MIQTTAREFPIETPEQREYRLWRLFCREQGIDPLWELDQEISRDLGVYYHRIVSDFNEFMENEE